MYLTNQKKQKKSIISNININILFVNLQQTAISPEQTHNFLHRRISDIEQRRRHTPHKTLYRISHEKQV